MEEGVRAVWTARNSLILKEKRRVVEGSRLESKV